MDIKRDRVKGTFSILQLRCIKKIIEIFEMKDAKRTSIRIPALVKLSLVKGKLSSDEATIMENVPYLSVIGSPKYAIIGPRPNIAFGVSLVSRFMSQSCESIRML